MADKDTSKIHLPTEGEVEKYAPPVDEVEVDEIEVNVTVEPVGGAKPRSVNFMVYEHIEDGSEPDYVAEVLESTEVADRYLSNHAVTYEKPECTGFTVLPVLQDLWGRPWDQYALNMAHSVRPSYIRVVHPGEGLKADARTWRLTVLLGADGRTIERMEQEVGVGLVGAKHGHGLRRYEIGESPEPVLGYYNPKGLERLEIYRGGPGAKEEGHHPDTSPEGRAALNQAADEHLMEILDEMGGDPDPPRG